MSQYKYAFQGYKKESMCKVAGRHLPLSRKTCSEIASYIKNKKVERAINLLTQVAEAKTPVPFRKYMHDVPHRRGPMAAGRFPKKASLEVIRLLKELKSNAADVGINEEGLIIKHAAAHRAHSTVRAGRKRGRTRKMCHFEIVGVESEKKQKKEKPKTLGEKVKEKVVEKGAKQKEEKKPAEVKAVSQSTTPGAKEAKEKGFRGEGQELTKVISSATPGAKEAKEK